MTTAAELSVRFSSQGADAVNRDIKSTGNAVQAFGGIASKMGTAVGTALGVVAGAGVNALIGSVGSLISTGLDFEAQMANVNSIAQLSTEELRKLSDQVIELTSNPGIVDGPAKLAEGLNDIVGAGFAGADGIVILEAAALGAAAGLTETAVATDALTTVINAYRLSADDAMSITDQMFKTVDLGKISFDQLASNLGNTVPIAASLGVEFGQLGAAYALMTQQGIGASQAETQISALMRAALNPRQQLTDAVQAHGHATAIAAIESEGLGGFLAILTEESGGSQEALFKMLGTTEAMNAATALGGENLDTYIQFLEEMGLASEGVGATQKALNKQMQSARFQINKAKQQVQVAATVFMGALAPGIAAAARAFTGLMSNGVIPFIDVISRAARGGFEFRDAIDVLPEPLQRTAGAIGTIVESVGDLIRSLQERGFSGLLDTLTIGGEGRQIIGGLTALAEEAWGAFTGTLGSLVDAGVELAPLAVDVLIDFIPAVGEWLWDTGNDLISWAIGHLPGTATRGDGTEGPAGTNAASTVSVLLDLAAQLGEWVWDAGTDLTSWAKSTIEETVTIDNLTASLSFGAELAGDIWGGFGDAAGWLYNNITTYVNVKNLRAAMHFAAEWAGDIWGGINNAAGWIKQHIPTWVSVAGLTAALSFLGEYVETTWGQHGSNFAGWFKAMVGDLSAEVEAAITVSAPEARGAYEAGRQSGQGFGDDFTQGLTDGFEWVVGLFDSGGPGPSTGGSGGSWWDRLTRPTYTKLEYQIAGFVTGLGETFYNNFTTNMRTLTNPFRELPGIIDGWLNDAMSGGASGGDPNSGSPGQVYADMRGGGIAAGWFDSMLTDIEGGIKIFIGDLTDSATTFSSDITGAIGKIIPDSLPDLTMPTFDIDLSGIEGPVTAAIETIDGWIDDLEGVLERLGILQAEVQTAQAAEASRRLALELHGPGAEVWGSADMYTGGSPGGLTPTPGTEGLPAAQPMEGFPTSYDRRIGRAAQEPPPPIVIPAPDISLFESVMLSIPQIVGNQMSAALAPAEAYSAGIGSVVGSNIGQMVGNIGALMGQFTNNVGQGMSNALSAASTYATAIYTVVSTQIGTLVGNTVSLMTGFTNAIGQGMSNALGVADTYSAAMAQVIGSNLAGAGAAAYGTGLAIGQGLAAGMNSSLGAVSAAADALASEADRAARARLAVASPSRVFFNIGENVGEGLALGIVSNRSLVADSSRQLAAASVVASRSGYRAGNGGTASVRGGGNQNFYGPVSQRLVIDGSSQAIAMNNIRRGRG